MDQRQILFRVTLSAVPRTASGRHGETGRRVRKVAAQGYNIEKEVKKFMLHAGEANVLGLTRKINPAIRNAVYMIVFGVSGVLGQNVLEPVEMVNTQEIAT